MLHHLSARRSRVGALLIVLGVVGATLAVMPGAGAVGDPTLAASCGIDIALVMDVSGSIDNTELGQMKSGYVSFVQAFLPETPTQFSLTAFDTTAWVNSSFTGDEAALITAINGTDGDGCTNWEAALTTAIGTFGGRPDKPNLLVFASDGNPNTVIGGYGCDASTSTAVAAGAAVASAWKSPTNSIIALGIGGDVNVGNLQQISSDVYTGDFATLAATLAALADDLCGGTITVRKLIDADGSLATPNDRTAGENWSIDVSGSPTNPSPDLTDVNGYTDSFPVEPGTYAFAETVQPGFSFLDASCTGATTNGTETSTGVTGIEVGANDIVACQVINTEAHAALKLVKHVINHGGTADAWDFYLSATNNADAAITLEGYGAVSGGVPAGVYTLAETGPVGYEAGDWVCAGEGVTQVGDQLTLAPGANGQCDITNEQGVGFIVIRKVVPAGAPAATFAFGSTYAGNFSLPGGGSTGAIEVPAGAHSVTEYLSAEQVAAGWALGAAYCNEGSGVNAIGVSIGETVTCTFENVYRAVPGYLEVVKVVDGGDAVCSDFSFSLDGGAGVAFEADCANVIELLAGSHHSVVEAVSAADYTATYSNCSDVEIVAGETATCTITNEYEEQVAGPEGSLTIIKETVPAGGTGFEFDGGALGAFSLDDGGSQMFTELEAGAYTIAEAAHADFAFAAVECEALDWVADGSSVTVNLAEGEVAVCTFTNGELPYTGSQPMTMPLLIAGLWSVLIGLGMLLWGRMRQVDAG